MAETLDILEEASMWPPRPLYVRVKYHGNGKKYPLKMTDVGDWCDLHVQDECHLLAGQYAQIPLGVSMELPRGYEAILAPRSSTFKKYGLLQTNGIGIIDNSYASDEDVWQMAVYATKEIWIPEGARLCQFRIQKNQPAIEFTEVESLGNAVRGGFGEGTGH